MSLDILIGLLVAGAIGIIMGLALHVIGLAWAWFKGKNQRPR